MFFFTEDKKPCPNVLVDRTLHATLPQIFTQVQYVLEKRETCLPYKACRIVKFFMCFLKCDLRRLDLVPLEHNHQLGIALCKNLQRTSGHFNECRDLNVSPSPTKSVWTPAIFPRLTPSQFH
ncbi:uncharacterized protein LOC134235647 [Saccostrea cucullata]|uniref:uncharacterized protein LOC134235647 n=1 Tax=Saccostrea cuccullata TaxID=36930 RepID=UPI002ED10EED